MPCLTRVHWFVPLDKKNLRGHHRGSEQGQVPSEDKFNESLPDKQEIDHHQMYPKYINEFADESDQHQGSMADIILNSRSEWEQFVTDQGKSQRWSGFMAALQT